MLSGAEFRAELQISPERRLSADLKVPEPGAIPNLPAGVRVGSFPPLHQEGEAILTVSALGKIFHRSVSQGVTITPPWYRISMPTAEDQKNPSIHYLADQALRPERIGGTVTIQSPPGALAGVLIAPAPGSEIILTRHPGCQESCRADLQLSGTAAGGGPLVISSGPFPKISLKAPASSLKLSPKPEAKEKVQKPPGRNGKRRLLWLALVGVGVAVLLVAGLLFWQDQPDTGDAEGEDDADKAPGKNILRLQAQLEALSKEKAQLQAALEEKNQQAATLLAEKADLQADLERIRAKTKGNVQSIEEPEKKLEEAEREAQGVQQEYTALYARNQQERENIKKN